jgi:ubiquinone/menaquinone biosynthesis C-methylase UbiE
MGKMLEIVSSLHRKTKRDYLSRMKDHKVFCMKKARAYAADFWDGDRRFGYGGYNYDGRWAAVARKLIDLYELPANAKILDIGCGKGFLLYEFTRLLPNCQVTGIDISQYAIERGKEEIRGRLFQHNAQEPLPFGDEQFDLAISLTTLHNLRIHGLKTALAEMDRVARNKYLVVESYRNEQELFNLECWALTAESYFSVDEWIWLFQEFGYQGDYEFIYFEGDE